MVQAWACIQVSGLQYCRVLVREIQEASVGEVYILFLHTFANLWHSFVLRILGVFVYFCVLLNTVTDTPCTSFLLAQTGAFRTAGALKEVQLWLIDTCSSRLGWEWAGACFEEVLARLWFWTLGKVFISRIWIGVAVRSFYSTEDANIEHMGHCFNIIVSICI